MSDATSRSELLNPEATKIERARVLRTIRSVRGRCNWVTWLFCLARWAFWGLLVALVVDVVLKVVGIEGWSLIVAGSCTVVAVVTALLQYSRRRITLRGAAISADKILDLKERLSSALELSIEQTSQDAVDAAWDTLLLDSAARVAEGIQVRKHFPMIWPREGRWVWCPLALLAASILFLPALDLWTGGGLQAQAKIALPGEEINAEALELVELAEEMKLERHADREKVAETAELLGEIDQLAKDMKAGKLKKRETMATLSDLSERIKERRNELASNPQAAKLRDGMMNTQEMAFLGDASERMQAGQFEEAAMALAQLEDRMKSGSLSEEQKAQLAKELESLSKQIDADSKLGQALSKAAAAMKAGKMGSAQLGMQAAQTAMAEKRDIQRQMEMLDRASQAVASSQLKLSGKSSSCSNCGKALTPSDRAAGKCSSCGGACSGSGEGAGGGASKGEGSGAYALGQSQQSGNGLGGPGQGRGGQMPFEESDFSLEDTMIAGQMGEGEIVGSILVDGPPEQGQAKLKFRTAVNVAAQEGEAAMEKELVPLAHRQRVRRYFYSLHSKSDTSSK